MFYYVHIIDIQIIPQSPYSVFVNQTGTVFCTAVGLSTPTVQWYKNNTVVNPDHSGQNFQDFKVPTSYPHTTVYTCIARNVSCEHTIAADITVIVQSTY